MRAERAEAAKPGASLALMTQFPVELAKADPIAGYWPVSTEMDPRPLLAALAKAGRQIALPRMESRLGPARFLSWRADQVLKADAFGVLAPPPDGAELKPQLIFVPLLAFDRLGNRLGQGGGHYDRILAAARAEGAISVGIAYAAQEMPLVPTEPHDARLDWIVTEKEAIHPGRLKR